MGIEVSEPCTVHPHHHGRDANVSILTCDSTLSAIGLRSVDSILFMDSATARKILDIFEETCGGRLIMNYNTIGGVQADLHPNFVNE